MSEPKFWMAVSGGAKRFDGGPEWIYPEGIRDGDYVFYYKHTQGIVRAGRWPSEITPLRTGMDPAGLWDEPEDPSQSEPLDTEVAYEFIRRIESENGLRILFHVWVTSADQRRSRKIVPLNLLDRFRWAVPAGVRNGDYILFWISGSGFQYILSAQSDAAPPREGEPGPAQADLVVYSVLDQPITAAELKQHASLSRWSFVRKNMQGVIKSQLLPLNQTEHWPEFYKLLTEKNPDTQTSLNVFFSGAPALSPRSHLHRHLLSDAPTHIDRLGFTPIIDALHTFLRSRETKLPLVLAVDAPWGRGKSSFMQQLERKLQTPRLQDAGEEQHLSLKAIRESLRERMHGTARSIVQRIRDALGKLFRRRAAEPSPEDEVSVASRNFETMYFNAWRHGTGNRMTGGLVHRLLQDLPDRLPTREREAFWLRRNLERIDLQQLRRTVHGKLMNRALPLLISLVVAVAGFAAALAQLFTAWVGWTVGGIGLVFAVVRTIAYWTRATKQASQTNVDIDFEKYIRAPDYESLTGPQTQIEADFKALVEEFQRRDRTLVIFIDDLDRCAPKDVADFVESINVFFAQEVEECIFILGMHKPFVEASLEVAYADLIAKLDAKKLHDELPFGQRFLEKIVQFIVYLPEADIQVVHDYIDHLSGAEATGAITQTSSATPTQPAAPQQDQSDHTEPASIESAPAPADPAIIQQLSEEFDERTPEIASVFRLVRDALRSNPRQYVRFFNALRFQYYLEIQRTHTRPDDERLLLLAKLTALSLEWPGEYIQLSGSTAALQERIESADETIEKDKRLLELLKASPAQEDAPTETEAKAEE